ncbi:nitroreductase family protein [Agrilactobacillus fermenti]|uniref:nitroreductase family protein n=1 Tax=Agrilactobacillus fermenti TaxID=2586909 RepID=UPI001E570DC9|nr:nitroreductase family protein [Agrilactobacillus fermenti]MCD2256141.1 nitroreductase family protein [Agrilactobacillus fermenti]
MDKTIAKSIINNKFDDVMFGRKSVRNFDETKSIDRSELQEMIAEATTAPSACNLQSWHFVVVNTPTGKAKVHEAALKFNYPQLETAPATIFIFGDTASHEVYREVWTKARDAGKISQEKLDQIFNTFLPMYEHADQEFLKFDATIDCAMVAMQLLLIARAHGYEAVPWAGYDGGKLLTALGLDAKRYVPVMAVSIGNAAEQPIDTDRYDAAALTEFV